MKEILKKLCLINGVSGNEKPVAEYCTELLSKHSETVMDFNNNVVAIMGNINADKTILLDAHIDQIGFIVTDIDKKGFISVAKCGGIDCRTLCGSPVLVYGKETLNGVICCMPPHLSDGKEDKALSLDKIKIDCGLPAEIVRNTVSIGDYVTFDNIFCELINDRVSCGALDNRAGVAVLLKVCELIKDKNLNYKVAILLSSQEETYAVGAITKAFNLNPQQAICVDVSFANQNGVCDQYSNIKLGGGPMICCSPTLNKEMSDKMTEIAKSNYIPFQTEVCGGRTGTNADHISVSRNGVKTSVISIPQKNMHTQVEIIDMNDIENTAKLIAEYLLSGGVE